MLHNSTLPYYCIYYGTLPFNSLNMTLNASYWWFGKEFGGKIDTAVPSPATRARAVTLTAAVAKAGDIPAAPKAAPGIGAPAATGMPAAVAPPKHIFGIFTEQEISSCSVLKNPSRYDQFNEIKISTT